MKNILKLSVLLFVCVALVTGCAPKEPGAIKPEGEYANAPQWVLDPSSEEGVLAALGIAKIGPAGMQFVRNEAMANGRAELARMMEIKVKDLNKNFAQQTGVGDSAVVDKVSSQVTSQLTNQTLKGSRGKKIWVSSEKNLHILVVVDPEVVKQAVKDAMETSYRNETALWQQLQSQKAHQELEQQVEKEFGN